MLKKQVRGLTLAALVAVSSVSVSLPSDAFAKRLGGGGSVGRSAPSMPQKSAPAGNQATSQPAQQQNLNKQQAAPAQQTPAAQPKRNWLGPIAGLAAGLGLAALFSHLGMGEGFANFMMMALLALVAFVVIRKIMSAMQGNQAKPALATQGPGSGYGAPQASTPQPVFQDNSVRKEQSPWSGSGQTQPAQTGFSNASSSGSGHQSAWDSFGSAQPHQTQFDLNQGFDAQSPVKVLPAGFDEQAFVSNAKKFYQMMQGLFDRGDLKGLGEYCS